MSTDNRTLAQKHLESLLESFRARTDYGTPFGLTDEYDNWHDYNETEDCNDHEHCLEASALTFFTDNVLDIKYVVDSDKNFIFAQILLSYGGPTVWLYTQTGELEVSWGGRVSGQIPSGTSSAINDAMAELYDSI